MQTTYCANCDRSLIYGQDWTAYFVKLFRQTVSAYRLARWSTPRGLADKKDGRYQSYFLGIQNRFPLLFGCSAWKGSEWELLRHLLSQPCDIKWQVLKWHPLYGGNWTWPHSPLTPLPVPKGEIQYLHKNLVSDNLLQFDFNKVTDIYLITYSSRPRPVTGIWMLGTTHQTAKFLT